MKFPLKYKCLGLFEIKKENYKLVPIRYEDRIDIIKWRNKQMYHLRQAEKLTEQAQDKYFSDVVARLFEQEKPSQILFSYLKDDVCIGYGGLVHINWIDKNAEISFVLNTKEDKEAFKVHWNNYLELLEEVSFKELSFHKIYTYAFDLRPHLYEVLEQKGFKKEAVLKEHCFFNGKFIDVIIHEKRKETKIHTLRRANEEDAKLLFNWANDKAVRSNAINNDSIVWEEHLKWYYSKLKSERSRIFILEVESKEIGQIRIDKSDDSDFWVIDYSIDKKQRGKGYGQLILKKIIELEPNTKLKGIVKESNVPSQKVFEALGFKIKHLKENKLIEYTYEGKQ